MFVCVYIYIYNYTRGVHYVHCVIRKCIMVKVGGNEIHIKYVKTRECFENMGEIFKSRRGNNNFRETEGEMYGKREIGGKICRGKVKLVKFSAESEFFLKIGGHLKQRGNASLPQWGWTPLNYI